MKIREFLALFEGRNPDSELIVAKLPLSERQFAVVGVANRGEVADVENDDAEEYGPSTLPTGCTPKEEEHQLPPGCKWDDTFVFLEEASG